MPHESATPPGPSTLENEAKNIRKAADVSNVRLALHEWTAVSMATNEKVEAFVDFGSIRIDGNVRTALFQYVYAPHSKKDERVNKWRKVSSSQETFNCANETSRVETLSVRSEDGTEWSEASDQLPTSWTPIGPNTLRDFQRRFICKGVPK